MQNLLTAAQTREVDAYTIQNQPIAAIDLMEQAAMAFVDAFTAEFSDRQQTIWVLCGQGNNGGDGLAIARLLIHLGYVNLCVFLSSFSEKPSPDYQQNLERLKEVKHKPYIFTDIPTLNIAKDDIVIDALLGSGLNKPLAGKYEALATVVNTAKACVVAVDVPTGFNCEGEIAQNYTGIVADLVITFQRSKINFFFPESKKAIKRFKVVPIGLDEQYIESLSSQWKLITETDIKNTLKPRENFSHKGTYGHVLIVAGNTETMGAALLTSSAALYSGAGLVTASIPQSGLTALNVSLPEVMFLDREQLQKSDFAKYQSIAVGPGLGVGERQKQLLDLLLNDGKPLVLDADALNILSENKKLLNKIPAQSIIAPHVKEFDRLFGSHANWWDRVTTAKTKAKELQIVIVLKNQYTFVCLPTGDVCINQTGNPAMAQGGMGDVLTGIIASFLAQGCSAEEATILAVYLHGKTGDILAEKAAVINASTLSRHLPKTLKII